jgi:hypothetical protein
VDFTEGFSRWARRWIMDNHYAQLSDPRDPPLRQPLRTRFVMRRALAGTDGAAVKFRAKKWAADHALPESAPRLSEPQSVAARNPHDTPIMSATTPGATPNATQESPLLAPLEDARLQEFINVIFPEPILRVMNKAMPDVMVMLQSGAPLRDSDVGSPDLVGLRLLYPCWTLASPLVMKNLVPDAYREHHDWRARHHKTQAEQKQTIAAERLGGRLQINPACIGLLGPKPLDATADEQTLRQDMQQLVYVYHCQRKFHRLPTDVVEALLVHSLFMHLPDELLQRRLLLRPYLLQRRLATDAGADGGHSWNVPLFPPWIAIPQFSKWFLQYGSQKEQLASILAAPVRDWFAAGRRVLRSRSSAVQSLSSAVSKQQQQQQQQQQRMTSRKSMELDKQLRKVQRDDDDEEGDPVALETDADSSEGEEERGGESESPSDEEQEDDGMFEALATTMDDSCGRPIPPKVAAPAPKSTAARPAPAAPKAKQPSAPTTPVPMKAPAGMQDTDDEEEDEEPAERVSSAPPSRPRTPMGTPAPHDDDDDVNEAQFAIEEPQEPSAATVRSASAGEKSGVVGGIPMGGNRRLTSSLTAPSKKPAKKAAGGASGAEKPKLAKPAAPMEDTVQLPVYGTFHTIPFRAKPKVYHKPRRPRNEETEESYVLYDTSRAQLDEWKAEATKAAAAERRRMIRDEPDRVEELRVKMREQAERNKAGAADQEAEPAATKTAAADAVSEDVAPEDDGESATAMEVAKPAPRTPSKSSRKRPAEDEGDRPAKSPKVQATKSSRKSGASESSSASTDSAVHHSPAAAAAAAAAASQTTERSAAMALIPEPHLDTLVLADAAMCMDSQQVEKLCITAMRRKPKQYEEKYRQYSFALASRQEASAFFAALVLYVLKQGSSVDVSRLVQHVTHEQLKQILSMSGPLETLLFNTIGDAFGLSVKPAPGALEREEEIDLDDLM